MTTGPVVVGVFVILSLCQISETGTIRQERFTVDPAPKVSVRGLLAPCHCYGHEAEHVGSGHGRGKLFTANSCQPGKRGRE